jgi:hypothetical protein
MKPESRRILNDPALVEALEAGLKRLEALYNGQPGARPVFLYGIMKYSEDAGSGWEQWLDESLDELAESAASSLSAEVFHPLIINYNPRGVHFVDHLLGADVFQMDDGSWQARVLEQPVGQLQIPRLEELPAWHTMQAFTRAFVERQVRGVIFALPTIASALNVALNLYGQEILAAMYEQPKAARRDLEAINDFLCSIHHWYLKNVPLEQMQCIIPDGRCQPVGYGQLCGCSTQLVSPKLYREFIAPLDANLLSVYPHGGMIHLCGAHAQHISAWREMESLRAVQVNDRAAEDLALYFTQLREDQILYVNPCAGMPSARVLEITGGNRLVLVEEGK